MLLQNTLVHVCRGKMGRECFQGCPHLCKTLSPAPCLLTLTHGAIGQLEALGTEALVGTFCVLALASQAAVLGNFTLIHICRATGRGPITCLRGLDLRCSSPFPEQHSWEKLMRGPQGEG